MKTRLLALPALLALTAGLLAPAHAPARAASPVPGPGWYLATVDRGPAGEFGPEAQHQSLELVSPDGDRIVLFERDLGAHQRGWFRLADWSPDGSAALLLRRADTDHPLVTEVSVPSGTRRGVRLPRQVESVLGDPTGAGVLTIGYDPKGNHGSPLSRVDWSGHETRLAALVGGPVMAAPDGSILVTGGRDWQTHVLRVLDPADGTVVRRVPTPHLSCQPVRWWDDSRALVTCVRGYHPPHLRLFSPATGHLARLSLPHPRSSGDLGDLDARRIDSGLYLQVAGPCGYVYVARQRSDGSLREVKVPHAVGNVLLVGGAGHRLVVEHATSCDGAAPRSELAHYDPVTHREERITLLARDEAFTRVMPFAEVRASEY
ncbi:MAG: hypothetical protein ACXVWV_10890 [Nocardioides sp.]